MDQIKPTPTTFEDVCGRLFELAYCIPGTRADAEHVVQEAYVCLHDVAKESVANAEAWLAHDHTSVNARHSNRGSQGFHV